MNSPHGRPGGGDNPGSGTRISGPGRRLFVLVLAFALPPAVFLLDYQHFGPIVRFGPFTAWTMAALGMAGYAAGQALEGRALLSGVAWALLAGGTLLAGALSLAFLPIILIASSLLFTCVGVGLVGTALVYGRAIRDARSDLDPDAVKAVLGTSDVELVCTEPGVNEWPG